MLPLNSMLCVAVANSLQPPFGLVWKLKDRVVGDDMDDRAVVRIYARENATQRGNHTTAQAGSVAAAIRFLFKEQSLTAPEIRSSSKHSRTDQGIGAPAVLEFLEGVPGVNKNTVAEQEAIAKQIKKEFTMPLKPYIRKLSFLLI
jgi:hypothetical protein